MFRHLFILSLWLLGISLCVRVLVDPLQGKVGLQSRGQQARRILLVTAHPDDECMFFSPTITNLNLLSPPPELFSLCLSVGDADGLGKIRRQELGRSLDVLGIAPNRRWLVDIPELQDNITLTWDKQVIADTVKPYVAENNVDTILTFDYHGISSHPNHKSIPSGIARLLEEANISQEESRVKAYGLFTVPIIHKYIGPVAALLAKFDIAFDGFLNRYAGMTTTTQVVPVFVSGIAQYQVALRAMQEHWSQLVWFRWLYVAFSRYMWVNEWAEIAPKATAV